MNWLFESIIRLWRVNDDVSSAVDVIVPTTYGIVSHGLATGSEAAIKTAAEIYQNGGKSATIAFAVSATTAEIYGRGERRLHESMFRELIPNVNEIYAGAIYNTIHEARQVTQSLIHPRDTIVVVTGPAHSRRARLIWKREYPGCKIRVVSFPWNYETQKDHPITTLRGRWRWLLVNIALYFIFLTPFGYSYFSKNCEVSHQPVVK